LGRLEPRDVEVYPTPPGHPNGHVDCSVHTEWLLAAFCYIRCISGSNTTNPSRSSLHCIQRLEHRAKFRGRMIAYC
ncbi:hypothetical protein KCU76_g81, partial [Aureobasidium melanogenum]